MKKTGRLSILAPLFSSVRYYLSLSGFQSYVERGDISYCNSTLCVNYLSLFRFVVSFFSLIVSRLFKQDENAYTSGKATTIFEVVIFPRMLAKPPKTPIIRVPFSNLSL